MAELFDVNMYNYCLNCFERKLSADNEDLLLDYNRLLFRAECRMSNSCLVPRNVKGNTSCTICECVFYRNISDRLFKPYPASISTDCKHPVLVDKLNSLHKKYGHKDCITLLVTRHDNKHGLLFDENIQGIRNKLPSHYRLMLENTPVSPNVIHVDKGPQLGEVCTVDYDIIEKGDLVIMDCDKVYTYSPRNTHITELQIKIHKDYVNHINKYLNPYIIHFDCNTYVSGFNYRQLTTKLYDRRVIFVDFDNGDDLLLYQGIYEKYCNSTKNTLLLKMSTDQKIVDHVKSELHQVDMCVSLVPDDSFVHIVPGHKYYPGPVIYTIPDDEIDLKWKASDETYCNGTSSGIDGYFSLIRHFYVDKNLNVFYYYEHREL